MAIQNYTPLGKLLSKHEAQIMTKASKEGEPKFVEPIKIVESQPLETEAPKEEVKAPEASTSPIVVIPELPEIDDELKQEGVEVADHDTIFVNSRKIDLPLPLEKIDQGLHKPLNSGFRWVAELTKYILARFHIVIKKVGGKFKLVEQN